MLRRIIEPKGDEVTGEWRKLHTEDLNVLFFLPNTVRVMKLRRMRWAGHVALMGERRGVYEGVKPLERPGRRWKDILKWIFRKWDMRAWTGSIWFRTVTGGGHL